MADLLRTIGLAPLHPRVLKALGSRFLGIPDRPEPAAPLSAAQRIVVVRLDQLGDVILTTPLLRELRHNAPSAHITLVTRPVFRELFETCPYVDHILDFTPEGSGRWPRRYQVCYRAFQFARHHLQAQTFDLAINPRRDVDLYGATYVTYFSGAPCRVGPCDRATGQRLRWNKGFEQLHTVGLEGARGQHETAFELDLLRTLGGRIQQDDLELWTTAEDDKHAFHLLAPTRPWIALAPGAGHPRRRWPLEHYQQVAQMAVAKRGCSVVVVGGRQDQELGSQLARRSAHTLDLTGQLSLRQTAAVLRRCRLLLSNDSGPAHMAEAVRTPVIVVSCHPRDGDPDHSQSIARFGPRNPNSCVLQPERATPACGPSCEAPAAHCILSVPVDPVLAAVNRILRRGGRTAGDACGLAS